MTKGWRRVVGDDFRGRPTRRGDRHSSPILRGAFAPVPRCSGADARSAGGTRAHERRCRRRTRARNPQRPYRSTVRLLSDALSLSPNERHDLERAAQRVVADEPSQHVIRANNLPVQVSSFVGRERDLAKTTAMLAAHRLVTLVGAGGVGKTRLALHAATEFMAAASTDDDLGGAWFADLSAALDNQSAMAAIASSVGMEQCGSLDALIGYLRSQQFLLILDNCEHLVDAVARLTDELLRGCQNARILATSRQALGLDGERIYRVPPLSVPPRDVDTELSIDEALAFGAIRLFTDRAEAVDSRFKLTDSMISAVAHICRRLDGIALAIELAAARTNAFPVATIAQRLDEHFLIFTGGTRGTLSRHKTMRTVFVWSYDLLDHREQSAFRKLSIFVNGFTLDLATSLWAGEIEASAIIEILASLVDKSLVQCDAYAEPTRYRMLEPARQYAREKLHEHKEQNATARAHASGLLAVAQDFDSRLEITPDREWDAHIEREYDNFRAALEWALGPDGDTTLAQQLAASRNAIQCGVGSGEMQTWVRTALATCNEATSRATRAKLELAVAYTAVLAARDPETQLRLSQHALLQQEAGDLRAVATAQYFVGNALRLLGRFDEADNILRRARAAARSCGAQSEYARATHVLASVRLDAGDLDDARALLSEAVQQERTAGSDQLAISAIIPLAEVEFAAGHREQAVQLGEEIANFFRARCHSHGLALARCNLSAYLLSLNRYEEARSNAREAVRYARAVGRTRTLGWALQHLAAIAVLSDTRTGENNAALARAAKLIGFVDASQAANPRDYTEQQELEKVLLALRDVFLEHELENLMTAGKGWSEDQAVAEGLAL